MRTNTLRAIAASLAALAALLAAPASAQRAILEDDSERWSTQLTRRPLTLDEGMIEVSIPVNFDLSEGSEGEPTFLNPSLAFGVTDRWTLGLRHFLGVCLTGDDGGCPEVYDDFSVFSRFSLGRTGGLDLALALALNVAPLTDDTSLAGEAGLMIRAGGGAVALTLQPMVNFGLNDRDGGSKRFGIPMNLGTYDLLTPQGVIPNRDWLIVPATLQLQLGPTIAVAVSAGVTGPINPEVGSFGDYYTVPVGAGITLTPLRYLDLGAAITFPRLLGEDEDADQRLLTVFLALRR
jgi:hypothetical protein